jgi:ubiquitin C-terminal hydrolase
MGPVVIMCLQRFKEGKKNNDFIDFPLHNLDMKEFVEYKNNSLDEDDSLLYDLYGVINHTGSLGGGHYTAKCFNHVHKKWFNFNDS